ncbi:DUF5687 family protein [Balneolaceae bacterium ANBcel3]|nr:DUF5687 family protein [Balneolaceae bacterium ANBcel3]
MLFTLLKHRWLQFTRSGSMGRGCLAGCLIALAAFLILPQLIVIAIYLELFIVDYLGWSDPVAFINTILLYYFMLEVLMRMFLQKLPSMEISAYLPHPIKIPTLAHLTLTGSLVSPFIIVIPLMLTYFSFTAVQVQAGVVGAWMWYLTLIVFNLFIHYGMITIRRISSERPFIPIGLLLFFSLLHLPMFFDGPVPADYTAWFFNQAMQNPVPLMLSALLLSGAYSSAFYFYTHNYHMDSQGDSSGRFWKKFAVTLPERYGLTGTLVNQEIRLIIRHKRARSILFFSLLFLFIGLVMYPDEEVLGIGSHIMLVFTGLMLTGMFLLQYGQFLFSWNSGFLDAFLAQPVPLRDYIASKYYLMILSCLLLYVLILPYAWFYGLDILLGNTCMLFYNMGINVFLVIRLGMWEPEKLDLESHSAFSFQGVGLAQWIMGLPLILLPGLLVIPFLAFGQGVYGLLFLGIMGLIGMLLRNPIIRLLARTMEEKKYDMAQSFRSN